MNLCRMNEPHPLLSALTSNNTMQPEATSLQRNIERLSRTIDPVTVSTALFARELIDQRIWEEARKEGKPHFDRSLNLLGEVLRSTQAHPQTFQQFCEILEQEKVTEALAAELKGRCVTYRGLQVNCALYIKLISLLQLVVSN